MAKKICMKCGQEKTLANFVASKALIHGTLLPYCKQCIDEIIEKNKEKNGNTWNIMNKVCQWADIPFVPEEWEKIYEGNKENAFSTYCAIFRNQQYDQFDWNSYNDVYKRIREEGRMDDALPETKEYNMQKLRAKWGAQYDEAEIEYLESLHQGMLNSQNIIGALQEDHALKLCKLSLIIEDKIRAGTDISKDLKAYDDLSKLANFTTQAVKDANDFSSLGEVFAFLEKKGWKNEYYDDTTRDEIDYTIKDIKNWLRYLYVNETGVAEEIQQRIQNLKDADAHFKIDFNEKEFLDYMQQQHDAQLDAEEFDTDV